MGFLVKFLHRKKEPVPMELQIKTISVGLLETNCYLVYREGDDRCVLIDPGADAGAILRGVGTMHVDAILLTHAHFDHIGAVSKVMQDGTELCVHPLDEPLMSNPYLNASWMIHQEVTAPAPTRLVKDGDVVEAAGLSFRVMHTPGHTPGGVTYLCEDAMFTGDTMFRAGYGRTDLPGGDDEALKQSVMRLMPLAKTHRVFPGHEG